MVSVLILSVWLHLARPAICQGDARLQSKQSGGRRERALAVSLLHDLADSHTHARKLLQFDPSMITQNRTAPDAGDTPNDMLLLGTVTRNLHLIKLALSAGADIDARNEEGNTPLYLAVLGRDNNVTQVLIDAGADVNAVDASGWQVIHLATIYPDNVEALSILVDAGADVNAKTLSEDLTPIHIAATSGHVSNIKFLIAEGAQFDPLKIQLTVLCACLDKAPEPPFCNAGGCRNDKSSIKALFD